MVDVNYGDTRDSQGRERFLQNTLQNHFEGNFLLDSFPSYFPRRIVMNNDETYN